MQTNPLITVVGRTAGDFPDVALAEGIRGHQPLQQFSGFVVLYLQNHAGYRLGKVFDTFGRIVNTSQGAIEREREGKRNR